jgi:succinate dehydrogenase / fumarate reductase membrane anchor subunit
MAFDIIKTGTSHFKAMKISSMALVALVPIFIITIGPIFGEQRVVVLAKLEQPIYALIVAVTFTVGLLHFKSGVQVLIEDYVHGGHEQGVDNFYDRFILLIDSRDTLSVD